MLITKSSRAQIILHIQGSATVTHTCLAKHSLSFHRVYRRVCKEVSSITETSDGRWQTAGDAPDPDPEAPVIVEEVLSCHGQLTESMKPSIIFGQSSTAAYSRTVK